MKTFSLSPLGLAAALLLAACGAQQMTPTSPGALRSLPAGHLQPQRRSWMAAGQSRSDLLYVSNINGEVTVYNYSQHALIGVLTDFTQPMGECAANDGNVYITDYAAKEILEFAHAGTKPIKKFDDSPDSPYACSIDPLTGNLAVANDDGTSREGNIAIWAAASGRRTTYSDSALSNFEGCAYSDSGDLLVTNGGSYAGGTGFAWLVKGGSKLINIYVPGPSPTWEWGYVRGIQWDGRFFAIDNFYIYRIRLIHGQPYYVGMTSFASQGVDPNGPYWIYNNDPAPGRQGTQVVGGMIGSHLSEVDYWHYPSGGYMIYSITHGADHPFGVTVSLGKP